MLIRQLEDVNEVEDYYIFLSRWLSFLIKARWSSLGVAYRGDRRSAALTALAALAALTRTAATRMSGRARASASDRFGRRRAESSL